MTRKAITASLLAAGFIAGAATTALPPMSQWTNAAHANTAINAAAARPTALPDFSSIVERNGPAVVNISVTREASNQGAAMPQLQPGDPFYEFFRRFGGPAPQEQ